MNNIIIEKMIMAMERINGDDTTISAKLRTMQNWEVEQEYKKAFSIKSELCYFKKGVL